MKQIKGKRIALNQEGNLVRNCVTIQCVVIANHHAEGCGWRRRKSKESSHSRLDKVMRAVAIHKNDELLMANRTEEAKGLRGEGTLHGIEANLGNHRRVYGGRRRGFDLIRFVIRDEEV